jgi:hypothetical protein
MTKTGDTARLRQALEKTGNAWLFRFWGSEAEKALEGMRRTLAKFSREYSRRFPAEGKPDPFHLLDVNPEKAAAFFQADTFDLSTEMQILVWRILNVGCEIASVEFSFASGRSPRLLVVLRSPSGRKESYRGQGPADYRVLRHFGSFLLNNRLALEGYYAGNGS